MGAMIEDGMILRGYLRTGWRTFRSRFRCRLLGLARRARTVLLRHRG